MRTIELYRKHKSGEISRDRFLYEVRRDKNLPWVTNITSYDDAVKILKNKGVISEAEISENFEVHFSDGIRQSKKFKDLKSAQQFAKELVATNKSLQHVDIFKAGPNFNSTTDSNALISWWGDGSYFDNVSKKDPSIASKQMSLGEDGIKELSPQTKYNAAMKSVDRVNAASGTSDSKYTKALRQGNKFVQEIDPVLKKAVEDFGKSLGFDTRIEKATTGAQYEPIVQIRMGRDIREPEIKVVITKNSDRIEGGFNLPTEADQRRLGNLIKQIQQKELDVELKSNSLNEADANIATDPAVDRVNPYYLKRGVQMLLDKEKELTNDSYIKALNKAALMLQKNPHAFDEEMFANAKDVEKADAKLETEEVKKSNHKNKANEMKKVKVKSLKEAAIGELKDYLKKKEQINEDSHYKHHVGSEVHTPDGEGKIIEIVGGTFTVEMKDGTHKDFQINTIDHFTQKAQEELPVQKPQPDQTVKDMWANWKGNTFGGMVGDPEHFKKPLDLSKLKEFIAKHKDDKEKMGKLKEAIKKLKEATKFHAGGEVIFTKDSEAPGYESDLKRAGVKYTKEKVQ